MTVVFSLLFLLMNFSNFGLAADIVLTVNPTQVEAKRQETVVLDCQGNTRNLYEYIIKWVNWKHVANDGTIHKITTGFYLDDGADETKYDIQHGDSDNSDTNYSFKLKILSVNDDDDGKYVCEYEDRRFLILSSKEVQFTVINPVEKVNFEILTMMTGHRMYSESQIMANSVIYEVEEGDFEVTCTAEGSNPTPQMTLKFNNNVQQVDTKMVKSLVGNRPSYKGTFTKVISLSAYKTDIQTIECSGGIPRKQFPDKYAGLKLKVFSVVPDVECENMSALVRYRQTKLTCRFHSMRALDCSQINWNDGNNNFVIYPGNKTHDPSYGPVVVDCDSVTHENNSMTVTTSLTFDLVQDAHFDAVFYVEYSYGKHEHRYPMKLSMKGLAVDIVLSVNWTQVEAKRQETVVLDCQVNTRSVLEYISKPVNWKHVANDGTIRKITTGFYLDDGADKTKYDIQHGNSDNSDTNYSFKLKILSVVDDDDGRYVCEIQDDRFVILSSKEVQVTVLNPVDKVKIELLTMTTGHRVYSESQIMADSVIYEVEEGDFEVTCTAEGSNPTPQMTLKFNNNVQHVDTNMDKSFVGNRPSYKGIFTKLFSLSADKIDIQTIECSAGIPRKQFPDQYAGLKLKVFPVAPDVECENVYALVRYKQTKLTCRFHSMRALDCSQINWNDGNNNFVIYPGNKTHDSSYGPVVVDCDSVTHENNSLTVTTSMTFDLVQDAHFDAVFYVEFSYGNHEHRYPVKLHMKGLAVDIVLSVKWTQVEAKRQETVVLDCQVNTRSVLEYISKPVNWKHVANDGTIHKITTGFYLDDGADKTKYDIQHGNSDNSDTNYSFKLKILSVVDDDDGKYVCEIQDDRFVILSSKEVQVTVLNPVDKVKIELLTMTTGHRVYSETQIMTDSVIYEVEEGDFEVTCTAEGSNPTPQMTLKFNNNVQQVDTNMDKSFVGNRPSYKGTLTKLVFLSADKIDIQTIECSAGIPRKQFSDKYAGLKLKVFPVAPDVDCENVYALVRYKQTKLTCRLHSMRALDCSHINWNDGNNSFVIYPGYKTHNSSYGPVVVDCDSVTHENNSMTVTTSLTFDLVQDAHFDAVFYVEFSYGKHEHRYPVKLHMKVAYQPEL